MLMDLLHGFEVLSTTEETLFNSRNVSRLVQNNFACVVKDHSLEHTYTRHSIKCVKTNNDCSLLSFILAQLLLLDMNY